MIKAISLYKSYHKLEVLKDIHLEIKEKEIVSITGASGAGKTTLLHILGTLDQMDHKANSSLYIDNTAIGDLRDKELSRFRNEKIGFIFQFHQLLPEFTALENVCIPAFIKKTAHLEAKTYAKELLCLLGLEYRMHHKPDMLSGGEQQRVAVARAMINRPKVIFADEPSGNLDSKSADELHQLFFNLREQFGQTFVIVTHNQKLAQMTDRQLYIKDGQLIQIEKNK